MFALVARSLFREMRRLATDPYCFIVVGLMMMMMNVNVEVMM